jgi:hypothetical protein
MAEQLIPTITTIRRYPPDNIDIISSYNQVLDLPNIIYAMIALNSGEDDNTSYDQGDLIVKMKNYPTDIDVALINGEFIVTGDDSASYSINSNGELIYTT